MSVGSTVCLLEWVCTWKTAGYVRFNRLVYSWERESRSKKETDLPSAAALSAARREKRLQRRSAPGHFYRLLLPLNPHRREVTWKGFFRGFSRTSCSRSYSAFCFEEPSSKCMTHSIAHSRARVVFRIPRGAPIRCGPAQSSPSVVWIVLRRLVEK